MIQQINKDTQLCMSLSGRPGNFGTRFHNFLYGKLDLNFIYKAFTTNNLEGAVKGIRALGIRGCAISMPFKEAVIDFLDCIDPTAKRIAAVNTIVNDGGRLTGYNTDYIAIRELLQQNRIPNTLSVVVLGSGGIAKAIVCALRELTFKDCIVVARNTKTGPALAGMYGYRWQQAFGSATFDVLINATPIGMKPNIEEMPFPQPLIKKAKFVFDAVADPFETQIIKVSRSFDKEVISGFTITVIQAREQFRLYTGVALSQDLAEEAAKFAFLVR